MVAPGQTKAWRSECKNRIGFHDETSLAGVRTHAKAHWIETLANRGEDQIAEGPNTSSGARLWVGKVVTLTRGVAGILTSLLQGDRWAGAVEL